MNTVHVIVEGQTDQILLEKLLTDLEKSLHIRFHIAGEKNSAHPLARTLQVRLGEPVALVLDADTNDSRVAEEEQSMYESYLSFTSKGVPFIVILIKPAIEEILFESPDVLRYIAGKTLEAKDVIIGKLAPELYLTELGINWTNALPKLNNEQLFALRDVEPVAKLREFLYNMTNSTPADEPNKTFAVA